MGRGQGALRSGWPFSLAAALLLLAAPARAAGVHGYGVLEGSVGFVSERSAPAREVVAPGFRLEVGAGVVPVPLTLGIAAGSHLLGPTPSPPEGDARYRFASEPPSSRSPLPDGPERRFSPRTLRNHDEP